MNNKSLETIRNYVEFNAITSPNSSFIICPHTNSKISNERLKANLDKINFYLTNKYKLKKGSKIFLLRRNGYLEGGRIWSYYLITKGNALTTFPEIKKS